VEGSTSAADVAAADVEGVVAADAVFAVDGVKAEGEADMFELVQDLDQVACVTWRRIYKKPRKHASIGFLTIRSRWPWCVKLSFLIKKG
jgi:hypothetical protein